MATFTELQQNLMDLEVQLQEAEVRYNKELVHGKRDEAGMAVRSQLKAERDAINDSVTNLRPSVEAMRASFKAKDVTPEHMEAITEERAKASYYKQVARKKQMNDAEKRFLGALDGGATAGNGELLLPVNIQTSVVSDAFEINPLRAYCTYTAIDGLQIPTMENDVLTSAQAFLKDGQPAKDLVVTAGMIKFAKERFAVKTDVAESVLNSTNVSLVNYIEGTLRSKLALTEHSMMFGDVLDHRNLLNPANAVPVLEGATIYDSILEAIYSLHPMFLQNAVVVMSPMDYVALRKELANSSETLFANGRKEIEGLPIILDATVGFAGKGIVIGDFSKYQFNYESASTLKSTEDIVTGLHTFVLGAEVDARIITPLAFKIVKKKVA